MYVIYACNLAPFLSFDLFCMLAKATSGKQTFQNPVVVFMKPNVNINKIIGLNVKQSIVK